ncbi:MULTISPECIES: hypothetical protein [Comamonas]|uniref:hypothetical protein n=1 Tax=Comamonas TaxID=283 RepID=UPI0001DA6826|nr:MULTISPECIES: hypothetical protein [Comamonas]EFI59740.1 hypothetical protein CTS44_20638 [Comamonas thiooxydans]TFF58307.1 hypothetical protein EIC84_16460 [Comamonas sp. A23]
MTTEEKACIECNELWPNDAEFFHRGRGNVNLLNVCHACYQERYHTPSRRSKKLLAMPVECSAAVALQRVFHNLVNTSQQQERKRA